MGRYIPLNELRNNDFEGDFPGKAVKAGKSFLCNVALNYPGAWAAQKISPEFVIAWWQDFCGDEPPTVPPPVPPPFEGGQCVGNPYRVFYRNFVRNIGNCAVVRNDVQSVDVVGAIVGIEYRDYDSSATTTSNCSGSSQAVRNKQAWLICTNNEYPLTLGLYRPVGNSGYDYGRVTIEDVQPLGGLPDDCGSLPGDNPPYAPLPPSSWNGTWNYTYNDNSTTHDFNITILPSGGDVNLHFPIKVNIGGLNVNFDLGGVNINGGDNVTNDNGNTIINNNGEGGSGIGGDGSNNNTDIDDPESFDSEEQPEAEDDEVEDIEKLAFVKLELTTIPLNAKTFSGGANSPPTFRAGWFEFKAVTYYYPREFIDFQRNIFVAPEGATGFAYKVNEGYKAVATIVTKK